MSDERRIELATHEFDAMDLGHKARTAQGKRIADALSRNPKAPVANLFASSNEVQNAYNWFESDLVPELAIIKPHLDKTRSRCAITQGPILAIHDTTELAWNRSKTPEGFINFGRGKAGLLLHTCLAVSLSDSLVLGLLHGELITDPDRGQRAGTSWQKRYSDHDKLSLRWFRGVSQAHADLDPNVSLIHVMDREGDVYELFDQMISKGQDFVVRQRQSRALEGGRRKAAKARNIAEALANVECETGGEPRIIQLSRRVNHGRTPQAIKRYPSRPARQARLMAKACTVSLARPQHVDETVSAALTVNVVEVSETECPEGQKAVGWVLLTTLPVATEDEIWNVVDIYRRRWLTEEYYKAVKSGCGLLEKKHTDGDALRRMTWLTLPIASHMVNIRHWAEAAPMTPAKDVVCEKHLAVAGLMLGPKVELKTLGQWVEGVARLGGYIQQKGKRPGWMILWRGYLTILNSIATLEYLATASEEQRRALAPYFSGLFTK